MDYGLRKTRSPLTPSGSVRLALEECLKIIGKAGKAAWTRIRTGVVSAGV